MSYYCDICNKKYKTAQSLWSHNKKYHATDETKNTSINIKKSLMCNSCNKILKHQSSLIRHQKTCKEKEPEKPIDDMIQEMIPVVLKFMTDNYSRLKPEI